MPTKIKVESILKFNIVLVALIATSYLKLFNISVINQRSNDICVLFCLISFSEFLCLKKRNNESYRYLRSLLLYLFVFLILETIFSLAKHNIGIITSYFGLERYLFLFFSCTILYVLLNEAWKFDHFLNFLLSITTGSYVIRYFISWYFGKTGNYIFESIATESMLNLKIGSGAIRNGILRVNPPCFVTVALPIAVWIYFYSKKKKEKILSIIAVAVMILFTLRIHQSRSALLYQLFVLGLMVLIHKRSTVKQLIIYLVFSIGVYMVINSTAINSFLSTFLSSNAEYGGSTRVRLLELDYYYNMYKESSYIFGIGSFPLNQLGYRVSPSLAYDLGDLGYLANVFRNGVWAIVLFFILFLRWNHICRILKKSNSSYYLLAVGITTSVLIWNINIDMFYNVLKASTPFIIGIMEYLYNNSSIEEKE